jgi:Cellulose-binding Sde182, nucleoside hydrolase-like domain/Cellulose-binding protein Sde0182, C-terminal domain
MAAQESRFAGLAPRFCVLLGSLAVSIGVSTSAVAANAASAIQQPRHRVIVLTDIGADPDDTQSIIRLLLYSDEIDVQGLVATTSTWKRTSVSPDSIHALIKTYAAVQPNLVKHDPGYPPADDLQALVKSGRPEYGMSGVGEGKDSEGSDWIIEVLERKDERPLWISIWGGANTLAQALYNIRATRSAEDVDRLVSKLRVYSISDQDDSGPWIRKEFPGLFYIVSPGGDYGSATWSGINAVIDGIDNTRISNAWLAEHIQQGHGPLGAAYPDVAWGMEGDTPSFLSLIPNGLNNPEHPDWGGWGGRYELIRPDVPITNPDTFIGGVPVPQETRPIWTNAVDRYFPLIRADFGRATRASDEAVEGFKVSLWRWRDDFQNDFAARMDWTVKSYDDASHPPVVVLDHPAAITVQSGADFGLGARESYDPDGDSLSFIWFNYPEAGTYPGLVRVNGAENQRGAFVTAPEVRERTTLHFIVRVTDKGNPPLTRYGRVVVTVLPP